MPSVCRSFLGKSSAKRTTVGCVSNGFGMASQPYDATHSGRGDGLNEFGRTDGEQVHLGLPRVPASVQGFPGRDDGRLSEKGLLQPR
eukprot:Skav224586  [mRNA]  locus=scaffold2684:5048:6287:- [translate_table: standard]